MKQVVHERTVVCDRYDGIYSGGKFIAWPMALENIPIASQGSDTEAAGFWAAEHHCGKGDTQELALIDLEQRLAALKETNEVAGGEAHNGHRVHLVKRKRNGLDFCRLRQYQQ